MLCMLNNYLFQNRLILKNRLLGRFFFLMNLLPFKLTCASYITLLESHFILFRLLSFPVPSDKALWLFCFRAWTHRRVASFGVECKPGCSEAGCLLWPFALPVFLLLGVVCASLIPADCRGLDLAIRKVGTQLFSSHSVLFVLATVAELHSCSKLIMRSYSSFWWLKVSMKPVLDR